MLILGGLLLFNPAVHSAQVSRPLIAVVALAAGLVTFFMLRALLSSTRPTWAEAKMIPEGTLPSIFRVTPM